VVLTSLKRKRSSGKASAWHVLAELARKPLKWVRLTKAKTSGPVVRSQFGKRKKIVKPGEMSYNWREECVWVGFLTQAETSWCGRRELQRCDRYGEMRSLTSVVA